MLRYPPPVRRFGEVIEKGKVNNKMLNGHKKLVVAVRCFLNDNFR
ncbi:hypothetical protein WIW89_10160 [Stygiolobus sp. CP850M]